jgi:N-acetylmuramoyl-L-alanine amidase
LERHGVSVLFTVYDDTDMSLSERCSVANNSGADIFVSLHANAVGKKNQWSSVTGWEIFVYRRGSFSEQLADAIHRSTIPASGLKDRGVKAERFYVIRNVNMPSALIEHGFYTSKDEVAQLKSPEFREQLAILDAKGILEFLAVDWIPA